MSNVNNITSKLIENAEAKKEQILSSAKQEKQDIIETHKKKGQEAAASILKKAEQDASSKKERMISHATLTVRNDILQEKQNRIQEVFTSTLEQLKKMDEATISKFIKTAIASSNFQGDITLTLGADTPVKTAADMVANMNKELSSQGKNIILSEEMKSNMSGFIIEQNGIEMNCSFEAIVHSMKEELEYDVAAKLFG